jgi:hypothetical protein
VVSLLIIEKAFGFGLSLWAQVEFLEWTDAGHLRHSKFVGLREDKAARTVVRSSPLLLRVACGYCGYPKRQNSIKTDKF